MSVQIIDTLKPKNNGAFPVAVAADIAVTDSIRLPAALDAKADASALAETDAAVALKASQADLDATNSAVAGKANASDLTTSTTNLQNQINNLITPVTEDAEVENARVSADGTSYTTLKERLDSNEKPVKAIQSDLGLSHFPMQKGYFSVSGNELQFNPNSDNRIATDDDTLVTVTSASEFSVPSGYKYSLIALSKSDDSVVFNAGWRTEKYILDPSLKYAITVGRTDDSRLNPEDEKDKFTVTNINDSLVAASKSLEGVRSNNIISSLNLYNAYYKSSDRTFAYSATILTMPTTDYIDLNDDMYIHPEDGYRILLIKYSKVTHEFIGFGSWKTADELIDKNYAYKIEISKVSGASIAPSEATNISTYSATTRELDKAKDAIGLTSVELVRGYWRVQDTPEYLYSATRLCTPDETFITSDSTIYLTPKDGYKIGVLVYDKTTHNYLRYESWSTNIAIPLTPEFVYRINFAKSDDDTITQDDSDNLVVTFNSYESLAIDASVNNSIIALNKDKESLIIQASMSRSARVAQEYDVLEFIHFSDIHMAYKNWIRICEYIDAFSDYLSFAIHTGDYVGSNHSTYIDHYKTKPKTVNIFNCVGNHDSYAAGSSDPASASQASTYQLLFGDAGVENWGATFGSVENAMYYYKDYTDAGIRLVVVDQYYWDAEEANWFDSVLSDAKANDLAVITAAHTQPSVITNAGTTFYSEETWPSDESISPTVFEPHILSFIENGGNHICHICGHHHHDKIGYTSGGILVFMIECATTDNLWNDSMRVENTKCFDAFNVMAVDRNLGLIKVVRIGSNSNSRLQGKNVLCYDYVNKEVISNY